MVKLCLKNQTITIEKKEHPSVGIYNELVYNDKAIYLVKEVYGLKYDSCGRIPPGGDERGVRFILHCKKRGFYVVRINEMFQGRIEKKRDLLIVVL